MKQSAGFFPTLREAPKEAEAKSHILMMRAGLIRQLAAGLYNYLPLGWRALRKVEQIVREEMDAAGAIEVLMPTLQPDLLWKQSGRWDVMGPELMRLKDRNERDFVLGPTHEEVFTTLIANEIRSYRDLPKNLYQIQTKFRDEIRPRFGIVRAREFIMKDAYSFDVDQESAARSYQSMYDAYYRIFYRCGLITVPVEADTGAMGGKHSHEFMAPADIGEAEIVTCSECEYKANRELTESIIPEDAPRSDAAPAMEEVHTPGMKTIDEVAEFLQTKPSQMIKTLIYVHDDQPFVVLIRGDQSLNEIKLGHEFNGPIEMASPEVILKVTGAPVGFAGPQSLNGVKIFADHSIKTIASGITGANKQDYHVRNVILDRDFQVDQWGDYRFVEDGDACPKCKSGTLSVSFGIEVGHVFILGVKYSEAFQAYYTDEKGERLPMIMGCYGIGVSRTLAAVIEEHSDENGIIWPASIAPYHVHILKLSNKSDEVNKTADDLYNGLKKEGFEVLLDDRDERPGIKFKDADLLGLPYRIVIGEKSLKEGLVEFVPRKTLVKEKMTPTECLERIRKQFQEDMENLIPVNQQ
ncbi:MAG: proline--tRNA ligase [Candidatus Omnitrophica bacterium]|nr:proline--tRNA ligase [Candidatus Omnitrophota bacterium]